MKIAVVTAPGIGDGLILHIASHHLVQMGHEVITFNDHLAAFGRWLKGYSFAKQSLFDPLLFDAVLLQHDNSPRAKQIHALEIPVYTFYGSHQLGKHGPLRETDFVANPNLTMVDNVVNAMGKWFGNATKENGLTPPEGLVPRKYPTRVAIHSSSGAVDKNWPREKFNRVAEHLKKMGYDPVFISNSLFPTLEDLASFLYESGAFLGNDSGPGHLASYLQIPSLIIAKDKRQMRLWRPGWMPPEVITPPWQWMRRRWKQLITTMRVVKTLKCKVLWN